MKRWVCPRCKKGVNAPNRMPRDDSRRYCLRCSATSPRLVERVCPARQRRLAAKAATRRRKTENRRTARVARIQKQRQQRDSLPWRDRDDQIRLEFRRLCRLDAWEGNARGAVLTIRRSRLRTHRSGHAKPQRGEVVITFGKDSDQAQLCMLLLHELAHVAAPPREMHGDTFRSLYAQAAREAYGCILQGAFGSVYGELDVAVEQAIREKLNHRRRDSTDDQIHTREGANRN